ncbi:hypothetical protein GM657_13670 [Lacticaseibacillus rhamnosus GG]|nr:hypothetical protein [Lacticaseibacillus rhamnosus]QOX85064.1 hypothetical protein GM657_13670 [Lacticaseibacillus rhamnosus GG]
MIVLSAMMFLLKFVSRFHFLCYGILIALTTLLYAPFADYMTFYELYMHLSKDDRLIFMNQIIFRIG